MSAPVAPWTGATNADVWTIDGLTFNAGADANGVEWIINSDTGWFGSAPSRNNRVSKNNAHGAYRSPVYRDPRVVAVSGYVIAPTPALREQAGYTLAALLSDPNTLYPITRSEVTGPRLIYAEQDTDTVVSVLPDGIGCTLAFSMQFAAPDPRKVGATLNSVSTTMPNPGSGGVLWQGDATIPNGLPYLGDDHVSGIVYGTAGTGGLLTMTNPGGAPADVLFTITGSVNTPSLVRQDTGDEMTFASSLSLTDVLTIDTGSGQVLFDGANYRPFMSVFQPIVIPPQTTITVAYSALLGSPSTTVTAQWRTTDW